MDYKQKYLKYKSKYLQLKGGAYCPPEPNAALGVNHPAIPQEYKEEYAENNICSVCMDNFTDIKCNNN